MKKGDSLLGNKKRLKTTPTGSEENPQVGAVTDTTKTQSLVTRGRITTIGKLEWGTQGSMYE